MQKHVQQELMENIEALKKTLGQTAIVERTEQNEDASVVSRMLRGAIEEASGNSLSLYLVESANEARGCPHNVITCPLYKSDQP